MQETVRQLTVFYDICDATRRFLGSGSNHWLCFHLMPRIRLTCPRPRSLESRLSGCEESCRRCWAALPQPAAARPDAGAGVAESRDGAGLAGESPLSRLVIDALRFEIQARRRPGLRKARCAAPLGAAYGARRSRVFATRRPEASRRQELCRAGGRFRVDRPARRALRRQFLERSWSFQLLPAFRRRSVHSGAGEGPSPGSQVEDGGAAGHNVPV